MPNEALHLTAIPLRSIAAGELGRSRRLRRREYQVELRSSDLSPPQAA